MSLTAGAEIELAIEKPAGGGRMIARHEGQIVLVQGAIPGERVRARVSRAEKRLAFATVTEVLDPSGDRRPYPTDPLCGGCLYAHIAYPVQLRLKSDVIADAFERIGHLPLPAAPEVTGSPERNYRMRARLHVRGEKVGFYREGTHELCDPAGTGQLRPEAIRSAVAVVRGLAAKGCAVQSVEITENIEADERVAHVEPEPGSVISPDALDEAFAGSGLTGCTARNADGLLRTSGVPIVRDPLPLLTGGRASDGHLQRHAESFFQANRYLVTRLVAAVLDAVPADGEVLDLYAGVGLFAVSLAASGRDRITAVEGDRSSGADLVRNAAGWGRGVRVFVESVEDFLARPQPAPATIVVDPPRTGISRDAVDAIVRRRAGRVVYVSCDPATMARDARRLLDGGYRLSSLRAFDLFPNTPHVESLGIFDRVDTAQAS